MVSKRYAALRRAAAAVRFRDCVSHIEALEGRALLAAPSISGLQLINADSNQPFGTELKANAVVTVDLKSTRHLNIRADASNAGSVRFGLDTQASYHTENGAPFAFASNSGTDYFSWTPSVGTHTITATGFAARGATSTSSSPFKVTLKVVDTGSSPPPTEGHGGSSPFFSSAPAIPSQTILFSNYDFGGEGVAYHDTDAANDGGQYRTNGVDIETNTDAAPSGLQNQSGVGKAVGSVRAGEYLKYTVNIAVSGSYRLSLRFASALAGGVAHLEVDGVAASGPITLGGTGGWQNWKTIDKTSVSLPSGKHVLKFVIDTTASGSDVGNLNWFRLASDSTTTPTVKWPGSWSSGAFAPSPRFESAGHVFGGKIYSFGGYKNSKFEVDRTYVSYDPNTNTWTKLGTLPQGMAETHLGVADDGRYIYFVGGFAGGILHGRHPTQIASSRVYRFDPANNTWTQLRSLPSARGAGGASIIDGKLHYMGGNPVDRVTNLGEHLVLDLSDQEEGWHHAASMPDPKDHFSTITIGTKIYTLGGEHGHDELADISKTVYVYDSVTDKWTRLKDMLFTNSHCEGGTFVLDGQIVFAGGQFDHKQDSTNRVMSYNPLTNVWKELAPLPAFRQGAIVGVFGNKVILTLGAQYTSVPQATTYIGYR